MRRVEHGRIQRGLQVEAEDGMSEEELKRPLVLLISARRAEGQARFAMAKGEGWAQRRARPLAAFDVIGMLRIQVEHLRPRAEAEAKAGNDRRALQPSSARRACNEISVPIGHGNVTRVASHGSKRL